MFTKTTVLVTTKLTKAYGTYPSNRRGTASPTALIFQLNKSYLRSRWAPASLSKPSQSLSFTDKLMSKRAWASKYYLPMQSLSRTKPWTINSGSRSCGLIMSHDMLLWRFVKSANFMTTSSFQLLTEKTFQNDNPEGFLMAVFHAMKCVSRWQKSSKWKHPMWKLLSVSRNELICNMPPIIQKTFGFSVTTFEEFRSGESE